MARKKGRSKRRGKRKPKYGGIKRTAPTSRRPKKPRTTKRNSAPYKRNSIDKDLYRSYFWFTLIVAIFLIISYFMGFNPVLANYIIVKQIIIVIMIIIAMYWFIRSR